MAGGGSERHLAVRISEILVRKKQVYHLFICESDSLVQANLSVDRADSGIRLKIRLCTMR